MTTTEQTTLFLSLGFIEGHTYEVTADGTIRDVTEQNTVPLVASRTLASQRLPAGGLETRSNVTTS